MLVTVSGNESLKFWTKVRNDNIIDFNFRKKSNGLPILSKTEIDDYAELLVNDFKPALLKQPGPMPIDEFIELYLNLNIDYKNLSADGNTLGMIAFNDGYVEVYDEWNNKEMLEVEAGTIFIDNALLDGDNQNGRCRFTFAHEPGHWLFHRHMYTVNIDQLSLFDLDQDKQKVCHKCLKKHVGHMVKRDYFSTDEDWQEWQADYFAAAFLMPKSTFCQATEYYMSKLKVTRQSLDDLPTEEVLHPFTQILIWLSETFEVSKQAAALRMYKLGYISRSIMLLQI